MLLLISMRNKTRRCTIIKTHIKIIIQPHLENLLRLDSEFNIMDRNCTPHFPQITWFCDKGLLQFGHLEGDIFKEWKDIFNHFSRFLEINSFSLRSNLNVIF